MRHYRCRVEVHHAPQESQVGRGVVGGDDSRVPGAVPELGLLGAHRLDRVAAPDPVGPGVDPGHRFGDGRLVVTLGADPGFEAVALLSGRCRTGAGVADDETDRFRFEGSGEQGDPSALTDAVQPGGLAGGGRVGTQHPDGGQCLMCPVLQGLVGPVPGRSSAPGLVVAQDDRPGVADPFRPATQVEPVPVA